MASQKSKTGAANNKKTSARQKKIRLQQVIMAIIGIVVILAMVMALAMNY